MKINKQGGANNFRGGQNIPENSIILQKLAFFKFQIQKINKQGGANKLRGGQFFSKKKDVPPFYLAVESKNAEVKRKGKLCRYFEV